MLGRSGGRSEGRRGIVLGARVPCGPWPPCAVLPTALTVSRRRFVDAAAARPMLQRPAVLGWGRGRSDGRASFVLVRVWHVARGSIAQEIRPFAWPCGRVMSRAAATKHWIVLIYPYTNPPASQNVCVSCGLIQPLAPLRGGRIS